MNREERLSGAMQRADVEGPLPGMISAFEAHFGQEWVDPDWRGETSTWAAAWGAARRAPAVPPGFALVPVEPTKAMLDAAAHASMQHLLDCIKNPAIARDVGSEKNVRKTHASRYRSMIAAAPQPPATAPVPPAVRSAAEALTADDIRQPKNGNEWRVEWWNESCRMMLPKNKVLYRFQSYRNGTLMFTLKERDVAFKGADDGKPKK